MDKLKTALQIKFKEELPALDGLSSLQKAQKILDFLNDNGITKQMNPEDLVSGSTKYINSLVCQVF